MSAISGCKLYPKEKVVNSEGHWFLIGMCIHHDLQPIFNRSFHVFWEIISETSCPLPAPWLLGASVWSWWVANSAAWKCSRSKRFESWRKPWRQCLCFSKLHHTGDVKLKSLGNWCLECCFSKNHNVCSIFDIQFNYCSAMVTCSLVSKVSM